MCLHLKGLPHDLHLQSPHSSQPVGFHEAIKRWSCGHAGQLFIIHTIKAFGALTFATVMTTRQFVSILLSCALFAHPLALGQWYAPAASMHPCASLTRPAR